MVITAQMIRDILTFVGPMSWDELRNALYIENDMDELGMSDAIDRALGLNFIYISKEHKDNTIYVSNWRE